MAEEGWSHSSSARCMKCAASAVSALRPPKGHDTAVVALVWQLALDLCGILHCHSCRSFHSSHPLSKACPMSTQGASKGVQGQPFHEHGAERLADEPAAPSVSEPAAVSGRPCRRQAAANHHEPSHHEPSKLACTIVGSQPPSRAPSPVLLPATAASDPLPSPCPTSLLFPSAPRRGPRA